MLFLVTYLFTLIKFLLQARVYILKRNGRYTPKRKLTAEIIDITVNFSWIILLPILNLSEIRQTIELIV